MLEVHSLGFLLLHLIIAFGLFSARMPAWDKKDVPHLLHWAGKQHNCHKRVKRSFSYNSGMYSKAHTQTEKLNKTTFPNKTPINPLSERRVWKLQCAWKHTGSVTCTLQNLHTWGLYPTAGSTPTPLGNPDLEKKNSLRIRRMASSLPRVDNRALKNVYIG